MTSGVTRSCPECGVRHRCLVPKCVSCRRAEYLNSRQKRYCALCGEEIPFKRRHHSGDCGRYCCDVCGGIATRVRAKASAAVAKAVKSGAIPRASSLVCVDCGAPAKHYDHRYYTRPLDVEPTCRSCNNKRGPALDVPKAARAYFRTNSNIRDFVRPLKDEAQRRREEWLVERELILKSRRTEPQEPVNG